MQLVNISITEVSKDAKKMHLERIVVQILKLKSLDAIALRILLNAIW
jgi:hypothetical protein